MERENSRMENMGVIEKYADLDVLQVRELEQLIKKFPWFSMARAALLVRLAEMGPEYLEQKLKDSAVYLPSRKKIYYRTREALENNIPFDLDVFAEEIDFNQIKQEAEHFELDTHLYPDSAAADEEPLEISVREKPRVIVAGGDYFTKEDFAELEKNQQIKLPQRPADPGLSGELLPEGAQYPEKERADSVFNAPRMTPEDFEAPEFYTETLARIYTEQGYYEEAINVYAKLILLYPEKSTYFALLVNEIKSKN